MYERGHVDGLFERMVCERFQREYKAHWVMVQIRGNGTCVVEEQLRQTPPHSPSLHPGESATYPGLQGPLHWSDNMAALLPYRPGAHGGQTDSDGSSKKLRAEGMGDVSRVGRREWGRDGAHHLGAGVGQVVGCNRVVRGGHRARKEM